MPPPTEIGRRAETAVIRWLKDRNFRIVERNWRTRWCEIDIIATSGGVIHFVEVKYRRRSDFGTGFDYITSDKTQRLIRAAMSWLHRHGQTTWAYQIDIASVSGFPEPKNVEFLPNAIQN